jgi:hypothetical protein
VKLYRCLDCEIQLRTRALSISGRDAGCTYYDVTGCGCAWGAVCALLFSERIMILWIWLAKCSRLGTSSRMSRRLMRKSMCGNEAQSYLRWCCWGFWIGLWLAPRSRFRRTLFTSSSMHSCPKYTDQGEKKLISFLVQQSQKATIPKS